MGIGVGIFLITLGLILALAVKAQLGGIDIQLVGWIIVGAGVVGLLMTLLVWGPRRRDATIIEERVVRDESPPPPPTY
jgi:Domain of unknown function (DUF6458)